MNVLFPSDLLNPKKVDESFQALFDACKESGFTCYLLNSEAWHEGQCKIYPAIKDVDSNTKTAITFQLGISHANP